MIVNIDKRTTIEDFHRFLYPIYRDNTARFLYKNIEYRIVFLSFDISKMKEEIHLLESNGLMEKTVTIPQKELEEKIPATSTFEPINYIAYPVYEKNLKAPKEHAAFIQKLKDAGIKILPHKIYMNNGLKIAYPERFLYELYKLKQFS